MVSVIFRDVRKSPRLVSPEIPVYGGRREEELARKGQYNGGTDRKVVQSGRGDESREHEVGVRNDGVKEV